MPVRDALWGCLAARSAKDARKIMDSAYERRNEMVSHLELLAFAAQAHELIDVMNVAIERLDAVGDDREDRRRRLPRRLKVMADSSLRPLAGALIDFGADRMNRGETARAEALFRMAGDLYGRLDGPESPGLTWSIACNARNYCRSGIYDEALRAGSIALSSAEHSGMSRHDIGSITADVGAAYEGLGRYDRAAEYFERALHLLEGESDVDTLVDTLRRAGRVGIKRGRYADARRLLRSAVSQQREESTSQLLRADAFMEFAHLWMQLHNWAGARDLYQAALDIRLRELPDEMQLITVTDDGSRYHHSLDGPETIEPISTHHLTADALAGLALALVHVGRLAEAASLNDRALSIRRRLDHPDLADSLNVGAHISARSGEFARAEDLWREGIQVLQRAGGYAHPSMAVIFGNLATMFLAVGRLDQARPAARTAVRMASNAHAADHPELARYLTTLGVVLGRSGDRIGALASLREAIAIEDATLWRVTRMSSIEHRRLFVSGAGRPVNAFLCIAMGGDPPLSEAECQEVFDLVVRHKGLELEALIVRRNALLDRADPLLGRLADDLTHARATLARLAVLGAQGDQRQYRERVFAAEAQRNQAEEMIAERVPELDLDDRIQSVGFDTIKSALPTNGCYVEYVCVRDAGSGAGEYATGSFPSRYLAVGTRAGGDPWAVSLGDADDINRNVASFRHAITSGGSDVGVGVALASQLIDPIADLVGGDGTRVVLVPDGHLLELPFDALPLADDRRLIDRWEIRYLGTGRDLVRDARLAREPSTPKVSTAEQAAVVIGDPDFDLRDPESDAERPPPAFATADLPFHPIASTREEARWVAEAVGAVPQLGARALKSLVVDASSPRILHLATHGYFLPLERGVDAVGASSGAAPGDRLLPSDPLLRSGLLLAGARTWVLGRQPPTAAGDGLLSADTVTNLDLTGTELVVLSACESGLGAIETGEGVHGLRRAFELAGARAVVMSLWQVDDQATDALMRDFYDEWLAGAAPAAALRRAQQRLRAAEPDRPSLWAAFICEDRAVNR